MTSRKITVRGIFDNGGELIRIFHTNGGGKTYFMDVEPSKDASIDEFCLELMPPIVDAKPAPEKPASILEGAQATASELKPLNLPSNGI